MKRKLLLFVVFVAFTNHLLQAQIKKGAALLGGQIGFTTVKEKADYNNNDRTRTGFTIMPSFGKAIKDNLIFGVDLAYTSYKDKTDNTTPEQKSYNIGGGVFLRKYVPIIDRLYLFGQGRLGGSYTSSKNSINNPFDYETKGFTAGIGFYPGISFAVNKKIHLESGFNDLAYINFAHEERTTPGITTNQVTKSNGFSIGSSLSSQSSFVIGIRILLAK